ncbi:tRNA (guanine(10)-N2)-methyltransferase [Penicillium atrosanguineum]|uniref:tRNA (guanine(10)-N(2))-methyltransferase n=1 Tax=Penicillium atrosanguineum TaxID=1132637 RepID=A0A9W9U8T7_9EURO|nr:tRNA (guanine(10)-N2)-methyltransferase [Penicillium atrosanguineum]
MEYMVRLAQCHETFRVPELQAVATLVGVDLEIVSYDEYSNQSPYCIVKLENDEAARKLISRTILAKDISELWGQGTNYDELHADVKKRTSHRWADYNDIPFAFALYGFSGKRTQEKRVEIIKSFSYTGLTGPVQLKNPPLQFIVMEEYIGDPEASALGVSRITEPRKVFLGRFIANSARDAIDKYDLKKRQYISTTSMDAELSLVTANMALAAPGKVLYDPFVGTGSFMVAASHFGALTLGSDIDPRSFRGKDEEKGMGKNVQANFQQYGIESKFLDTFTSDLTNTPLRNAQLLDGIICDPPYGVREGLRVLGTRDGKVIEPVVIDGVLNYYRPGYIPPKRPYGFEAIQRDVLDFAVRSLVPNGRLTMWMPTTNDEAKEFPVPMHPNLEVIAVSVQYFSNWARRLMTYRRLPEGEVSDISKGRSNADQRGITADELNGFRRKVCAYL